MSFSEKLNKTIPIYPLITFRILFGIMIMFSTARFVALGWIEDHYVQPTFHFKYYGFEWVEPMGLVGMYAVHIILFLSALAFTLGYRYRWAACIMFISFTYTELIDLAYYLNHYYFVSLMSFIMIFLPAHNAVSLDVRQARVSFANRTSAWTIYVVMLMVAIVYCYAGFAKINYAWLIEALPLKIWLPAHDHIPLIGSLFAWNWTPYLFSWFGMVYDTTIVFFLLWPLTRKWAYFSVIVFHVLTGILFQIGVFPIVMICAASIYFSGDFHKRLLYRLCLILDRRHLHYLDLNEEIPVVMSSIYRRVMLFFFAVFFAFQLLFPWRYLLYPGNVFWTEQGYRFSWRVMLMEKSGSATFYVQDGVDGRKGQVFNDEYLNDHQEKQMAMQPDMILQYAHHIANVYRQKGMENPVITVESYVTLNGSKSQLLIDPKVNLAQIQDDWSHKWWVKKWND